MKLQFKHQQFQADAVDAVVDCFTGQPRRDPTRYRVDPGARRQISSDDSGFRNAELELSEAELLTNIHAVQTDPRRRLATSTALAHSPAAPSAPNLDIEMETGTGKTYVYIKTIMELHKQYGWSKFIVVVPSVAIREGVLKSFELTAAHFQQDYGTTPRAFVYNSSRLHEIETFSSDAGIRVMIINIQAFNATGKDARRIYEVLDDFQSRRPIDVIAANRPIVIIDEPQRLEAKKTLDALARFNSLFILRYSATHKVPRTLIHRLDAVDAYNQKLVKRIAVRGITVHGIAGLDAYMYLDSIEIAAGRAPRARMEIETKSPTGAIRRTMRLLDHGTNLYDVSGGIEAYRGLFITDIDAVRDVVELSNGAVIDSGQITANTVVDETKRRIQIREVIDAHLTKERSLFAEGIKVLSLFFIDEVAHYRDYTREDTLGTYARIFEEEYQRAVTELQQSLALHDAEADYLAFLQRDTASAVHAGYFSVDKKTNRLIDPKIAGRGEDKGLATDESAYDLILKDKERLLSQSEPVRFLFSHSALREGWDNPNVFVMGMLKKSDSTISRRQEIGRGLRLCVNQAGERVDDPARVHEVNELTVVTDESYTEFVTGLQKEISETLASRPRAATPEFFTGKKITHPTTGVEHAITELEAKQLCRWLAKNDFIDLDDRLTDLWHQRDTLDPMPALPEALAPYHYQVTQIVDSLVIDIPAPTDDRRTKPIPLNKELFDGPTFRELWSRINRRATYHVDFDTQTLITSSVAALDHGLHVDRMTYRVDRGAQNVSMTSDDVGDGRSFSRAAHSSETPVDTVESSVAYDLIGELAEHTALTRRTIGTILSRITPNTFARFAQNPEQFLRESARIINEQKATLILENLRYSLREERHSDALFTADRTKYDLTHATKLNRHIYEYAVTDSAVERRFVEDLDTSDDVIVYAKLPHGFVIPTPVGDYNPDWAIAFTEGSVEHVFFVAETKSTHADIERRGTENAKITAARRFFAALNAGQDGSVTYDVVTDVDELFSRARG